jgi:hypothetical protein
MIDPVWLASPSFQFHAPLTSPRYKVASALALCGRDDMPAPQPVRRLEFKLQLVFRSDSARIARP